MPGEFIARNGVISRGNVVVTGSLTTSGSLTTTGTITATTLVVQTITSSISSVTGSTNFGSLSSNTHTFTGSILASGSVGIGITPFNNTLGPSLDMRNGVGIFGYGDATYLSGNMYFDGAWKVKNAGTGSQITLAGEIVFNTSNPTGSAGTNVTNTERMRITNRGDVGLGTVSPTAIGNYRSLTINGADGSLVDFMYNGTLNGRLFSSNDTAVGMESLSTTLPLYFKTQNGGGSIIRMAINPAGIVSIGTTTLPVASSGLDVIIGKSGAGSAATVYTDGASTRWGFVYANASQMSYGSFGAIAFETGPTASEKMRITSAGQVTIPNQPSFYATSTAGSSTYSGSEVIVFNTTRHNIGSCYNTSNGRFTAPVAGRYLFMFNCYNYAGYTNSIVLTINGSQYVVQDVQPLSYAGNVGSVSTGFTIVWELAVNDYVEVRVRAGGSANIYRAHSHFSGHLLG